MKSIKDAKHGGSHHQRQGSGSATELLQMPTDSVELEEQPQHDDDSQKKYVQDERKQQESYMKEFVPKDALKKAMRKEGVKGGHEWDSDGEDAHHEMSADDRLMKSIKDAKQGGSHHQRQ